METIKDTFNQASETVQQGLSTGSKEANKTVAKDSNASAGTRLEAGKDAIGDKVNEKKHETKANAYDAKANAD